MNRYTLLTAKAIKDYNEFCGSKKVQNRGSVYEQKLNVIGITVTEQGFKGLPHNGKIYYTPRRY